jgi:hypothetical protein
LASLAICRPQGPGRTKFPAFSQLAGNLGSETGFAPDSLLQQRVSNEPCSSFYRAPWGDLSRRSGAGRPSPRDRACWGGAVPRHVEGTAARRVRPVKLKKGVECKPDAEGEAWPTGRQQSQAMLFYGHAEPRIPRASNCGIISTVPPRFHSFVRGTDGSNPA